MAKGTRELFRGVREQERAGRHRRDDASALFDAARWRGCMYMAGYSVECLLKAKLMRRFSCHHLSALEDELQRRGILTSRATVFTHQLEVLLRLTQGTDRLRQNLGHWRAFNTVNRWLPAWRYNADLSNRDDAQDFLSAVTKISNWIEHNI